MTDLEKTLRQGVELLGTPEVANAKIESLGRRLLKLEVVEHANDCRWTFERRSPRFDGLVDPELIALCTRQEYALIHPGAYAGDWQTGDPLPSIGRVTVRETISGVECEFADVSVGRRWGRDDRA